MLEAEIFKKGGIIVLIEESIRCFKNSELLVNEKEKNCFKKVVKNENIKFDYLIDVENDAFLTINFLEK